MRTLCAASELVRSSWLARALNRQFPSDFTFTTFMFCFSAITLSLFKSVRAFNCGAEFEDETETDKQYKDKLRGDQFIISYLVRGVYPIYLFLNLGPTEVSNFPMSAKCRLACAC